MLRKMYHIVFYLIVDRLSHCFKKSRYKEGRDSRWRFGSNQTSATSRSSIVRFRAFITYEVQRENRRAIDVSRFRDLFFFFFNKSVISTLVRNNSSDSNIDVLAL